MNDSLPCGSTVDCRVFRFREEYQGGWRMKAGSRLRRFTINWKNYSKSFYVWKIAKRNMVMFRMRFMNLGSNGRMF